MERGSLTPRTQESEQHPMWKIFEEAVKKAANSVVQPKDASQPKTNFEVHVKPTHGSILYDKSKEKFTHNILLWRVLLTFVGVFPEIAA